MPLLNYRTRVSADRTAAEVAQLLAKAGASRIMTEYESDGSGRIIAIAFELPLGERRLSFRLPTDWRPVQKVLAKQRVPHDETTSRNVAWRITKDWVEAQLAIIQTQMVTTAQVFLPYAITDRGITLYEQVAADPSFLLGPGHE
jgi:hypothetical protein